MKFLGVTAVLSLFAAGTGTVLLDRRYPMQDTRQEILKANKVATISAIISSRGVPISSLHARAINGSEAPAHPPESWPDIERAKSTTLIAMDKHPLEWHTFNRRTGPRMIGTYRLEESMALVVLDQQRVLLVHNSMRRWQADGILELEAALPHELRDTVAYIARPSECTLFAGPEEATKQSRWEIMNALPIGSRTFCRIVEYSIEPEQWGLGQLITTSIHSEIRFWWK